MKWRFKCMDCERRFHYNERSIVDGQDACPYCHSLDIEHTEDLKKEDGE